MKICLMFIKKGGGYPLTGGGFHSLTFNKPDAAFITKILNELEMTDDSYHYAISTVITCTDTEVQKMDRASKEKMRLRLMKSLWKELLKFPVNKFLTYNNGYIYISNDHRLQRR
jgi:hypothetical protein